MNIEEIKHMYEGKLAYKVVDKDTRDCSNWSIFKRYHMKLAEFDYWENFKIEHSQYFPVYDYGKLIKMAPGSIGLMCFATKSAAEEFIRIEFSENETIIIQVKGYNELSKSKIICGCGCDPESIINISKAIKEGYLIDHIRETLFFEFLEVLE